MKNFIIEGIGGVNSVKNIST